MTYDGALAAAAANDAGGNDAETAAADAHAFATPPHVAVQQMAPQYDSFLQADADGVYDRLQNADTADARNVTVMYQMGIDGIIRNGALGSLPAMRSLRNRMPAVRQGIDRAISGVDDAQYANGPCYETLHLRNVYDRVIECLEYVCPPQDLTNAKRAYKEVLITHVIHSIERIHAAHAANPPDSDED